MLDVHHPAFALVDLTPLERLVLVAIGTLTPTGGWCWARKSEIARLIHHDRGNTSKVIKRLIEGGIIEPSSESRALRIAPDAAAPKRVLSTRKRVPSTRPDDTAMAEKSVCSVHVCDQPTTTQKIKDKRKEKGKEIKQPAVSETPTTETPMATAQTPRKPRAARRSTKNPKRRIAEDWEPGEATIANLTQIRQIPLAFVMAEVIEFIIYWRERGDARAGWDATFCNHVKKVWKWSQDDEKQKKYTDAAGRPISEYDKVWRDNAEGAWSGTEGFDIGTTVARDNDGNDVLI